MTTAYTGNSLKSRQGKDKKEDAPKKEIQKVIKGGAKKKKKSEISKIASNIISEEATSIKEYAIYEVVIPVIKDTITQLIKGSIDMLFYGEVRSSSSRRSSVAGSKVSYSGIYDDRRSLSRRDERLAPTRFSYDNVTFEHKEDAEEVLNRMDEIVEQYGIVTVADLFDLAGITGNGYTDQNYGWTSTRSASVERDRQGDWFIKMQKPSSIR